MESNNFILIGEYKVPISYYKKERYYPIGYICKKILLTRSKGLNGKDGREKYKKYIRKLKIDFGKENIQETNCINAEGLKKYILNMQSGRMNLEQKKANNLLREYLRLDILKVKEKIINGIPIDELNLHDEYTSDIIKGIISKKQNTKFQLCEKCELYYPLQGKFYSKTGNRNEQGYAFICRRCSGYTNSFAHHDRELSKAYDIGGEEYYKNLRDRNAIEVYKEYIKNDKIKKMPRAIKDKESYLKIIKYTYNKKLISKDRITASILEKEYGLTYCNGVVKIEEIYVELFGEDFYYYPWKYKSWNNNNTKLTKEVGKKMLENYLAENKIVIDDVFSEDYRELIKKVRITKFNRNILDFVVYFYEYRYPGYKFNIPSINFYKDINNRIFDMKWLIEKDMKVKINKIPLYLTNYALQKKSGTLYNVLKKYYRNLFEWVNECYPGEFIEADFVINPYRNKFDSDQEAIIHDILKSKFKNVIYNQRNTEFTIEIKGMIPDWIIHTDDKCWLVEFYGLYIERDKSSRAESYRIKHRNKMKKYKTIDYYGKVFLYPDDLDNDFEGIHKKIEIIK